MTVNYETTGYWSDWLLEDIQCAPSQFSFRIFTWLFVVYILKEKLAQNHTMTSQKFCEFGFPFLLQITEKSFLIKKFRAIVLL